MQRNLTPRAHNTAPTFAALFLAAAAGGGAAYICTGAGRHVGPGAAPEACSDFCLSSASSHSLRGERPSRDGDRVEVALHGCDSVDVATRADRLALVFFKKKVKKKIKALREMADRPAGHVTRIPMIDVDPQKVSPQTHPAIPLLRTVVLLA